MARRKTEDRVAVLKAKAGPRSGNVRVVLYVKPKHLAALHALARERAQGRGALRPDLSDAAQVVFEDWMAMQAAERT